MVSCTESSTPPLEATPLVVHTSRDMQSEPVFFGQAFEGLYLRGLGARRTPALTTAILGLGVDLDKPLHSAYRADVWYACLQVSATHLFADRPLDAALEELGSVFFEGFQNTLVGQAALHIGKLFGIERMLLRMGRNSRTTSNLHYATASLLAPQHVVITERLVPEFVGRVAPLEPSDPAFIRGALTRLTTQLGADASVEPHLIDNATHHVSIDVRWRL
jgi:uncharacterized protein (TIGR02265 family)